MKKKLFSLLLALAMLLGLTACAREEVPEAPAEDVLIASYLDNKLYNKELQYWYWDAYYAFVESNGYSYYFDPNAPLKDQALTESNTWQDYFVSNALNQWLSIQLLNAEAVKNGHKMPAELQTELDNLEASVTVYAKDVLGESDMNQYFEDYYGAGANMAGFKAYTEKLYYANSYGDVKYAEFLEQVTKEITDPQRMINVRHILICPVDATVDADWAGAKQRAERFYEEWKQDATEDNFSRMAGLYTEDPGSKDSDGLYENVYPGQMVTPFNDWCFDASRQIGDHGIVETSYGYHIMYFAGWGDVYAGAFEDEAVERYYDWLDSMVAADSLELNLDNVDIQLIAIQRGDAE